MVAWGLATGQWSVAQLVDRLAAHEYEWLAIEWDDPLTQDTNRASYAELRSRLHAIGKLIGPWFTEGGNAYLTPGDADLLIAEQEGPGDYQGITYCENQGLLPPGVSKGVCTNFSTIGFDEAGFLVDREWTCLPEAYMNELAHATPTAVDFTARQLGWPTSQPVAGVYPTASAPDPVPLYDPWADWPLIDYLGEYVLDGSFSSKAAMAWQDRRTTRRARKATGRLELVA